MLEKIKKMISSQLNYNAAAIKNEDRLIEDLGADSLDIVEMLMTLEEEFGVSIPDEDAEKLKTVSDIVSYLEERTK